MSWVGQGSAHTRLCKPRQRLDLILDATWRLWRVLSRVVLGIDLVLRGEHVVGGKNRGRGSRDRVQRKDDGGNGEEGEM